jgi:hypothetical protein
MKIAIALAVVAGLAGPAAPALAATGSVVPTPAVTTVAPDSAPPIAAPPIALVARYTFDGGVVNGQVADTSGKAPALTVRAANQGALKFLDATGGGQYVAFPGLCPATTTDCPRSLLEAPNDADLNPGTRLFHWSARVLVTKDQVKGSANIMQKGVANTSSQWKMQIGATQGRAQCVVVGVGSPAGYLVRSSISVADGQWHKILCERSGTSLNVYVDGLIKGTATIPSTLSISNTRPMRIGGANFNPNGAMYHGLLDDVYAELG